MARIYLSATYNDLKPYRDIVYRVLGHFIEGLDTSVAIKKVLKRSSEWEEKRCASVVKFYEAFAQARTSLSA